MVPVVRVLFSPQNTGIRVFADVSLYLFNFSFGTTKIIERCDPYNFLALIFENFTLVIRYYRNIKWFTRAVRFSLNRPR
jgi:hypothetical protein